MVPEKTVTWQFEELLEWLRKDKPNDRSEKDRYFAIVITDVEKAKAVFLTYAAPLETNRDAEDGFPGTNE